jgi:hypothetical protein
MERPGHELRIAGHTWFRTRLPVSRRPNRHNVGAAGEYAGIVKTFVACSDAAISQPSNRPTLYKGYRFPPEIISHCVWLSLLNTRSWVHERRSNAGQLAEGLSSIASTGYRLKGRPNSDTCWADLSPDFAPQGGETSYAAIRS